ncbi:MAG: tetratricopeptide repeat protein [Woeseiaceae bacterium]
MNSELLQGFYLGDLFVEPLKGRVSGKGEPGHLPPKAVEVLLCLAQVPGELVTREALLDEVWGHDQGSQEALNRAIGEIRHALGDHADQPKFVQTLPRRGYRLIIPPTLNTGTTHVESAAAPGPRWWQALLRHGVIQTAAAYLVAGWLLIQVADITFSKIGLPPWSESFITFVVIGGFPLLVLLTWCFEFIGGRVEADRGEQSVGIFRGLEQNYIAIFIAYGLSALGAGVYQATVGFEVAEAPPVRVVTIEAEPELIPIADNSIAVLRLATFDQDPRTRAFTDGLSEDILDALARVPGLFVSARGDAWSLPSNASSDLVQRRLRVANYLEGSVRFHDDKLRVVIQLIESKSGFHVFSRDFDINIAGIADMQRDITRRVIANLKLAVDLTTLDFDNYYAHTPSEDAYYMYLLGKEALSRPRSVANITEAIGYFDNALLVDAEYPAALAGRCRAFTALYEMQGDTADISRAEAACAQALSIAPRLPVVLVTVAHLYIRTGKSDAAAQFYEEALAVDPQSAAALQGLALIRRRDQRFDEAERLMRLAIELQPGNWSSINTLGNMYFRMGRFEDAIAEYRKVVYLDSDNFVTLGNLGSAAMMTGDFPTARDALAKSVAIDANNTHTANLGISHYYLGDFANAIAVLQQAVDLAPDSSGNWISLADALRYGGDHDDAQQAYRQALELARSAFSVNADDTEALMFIGWSAAVLGDGELALASVTRAADLDPADPYAHYYHAIVLLELGSHDAALDALRRAVEEGYPVAMLAVEPILEELKDDPGFVDLLTTRGITGEE